MGSFYENKLRNLWIQIGAEMTFPAHFHENVELVFLLEGSLSGTVDGLPFRMAPGGLLFIFPNCIHKFEATEHEKHIIAGFSTQFCAAYRTALTEMLPAQPYLAPEEVPEELPWLIHTALKEPSEQIRSGYLTALTGLCLRKLDLKPRKRPADLTTAQQVIGYCLQHFTEEVTLEGLSAALNVNKYHISHLFSEKIGQRLKDYLHALRAEQAARLLRETDQSVTDIALECGFESVRTFNRAFRSTYGVSPREWRARLPLS